MKKIFFLFSLFFISAITQGQVIKTEGFDNNFAGTIWPNVDLPFGWSHGRIAPGPDVNNYWDRVNAANGVLPACTPHLGSIGMIRYRSAYCVTAAVQNYISSRPYDLSARGAITSQVSFWVYREGTAGNDNIQVYANNNPDPTIAAPVLPTPLMDMVTAVNYLPRPCNAAPIDPCGVWTQHTFIVPAANYSTNSLYIIIKVTDAGAQGANVYIDDFSIQTFPSVQAVTSIGLDFQNIANLAHPSTGNWIIGCRVTVANEGNQCSLGAFTFTHNGTTNPGTDIANSGTGGVRLYWTGGTNALVRNAAGQPINAIQVGSYVGSAFPVSSFSISPVIPAPYNGLLNGNNYFWLVYDISAGAVSGDYVDADFISANICSAVQTCGGTGCSKPGGCLIGVGYCVPSYTVGTSGSNGAYTNNDYIKNFHCNGDPVYPPGIHNDHNDVEAGSFPSGAGYPADPCVTSPTQLMNGTTSPFSPHPSDYQKISPVNVPNMCSAGTSSRTAVFLVTSVAPPAYPFTVQCGTWYGNNYIAAFIDLNHDGIFNAAPVPGGERIFHSGAMNALATYSSSFTLPYGGAGQYYGLTTLRVREWYGQSNMDACSPGYYGEVEDYTVILRHECSSLYPGWKIWEGYTDDWNTNTNWCGGLPTINDNALIPGKGTTNYNRGPNSYHPVIKSGVLATARKLVMLNDTVEINAPVAGSVRVSDSLSIGVASAVNTSALIVDSSYSGNAVLSNGVYTNTTWLPFRASYREQKCQLMYKGTELLAQGMISGDVIDAIVVPVRSRKSTSPFASVQISMYFATINSTYPNFTNSGYTMPVPVAPANCLAPQISAPVVVYSGPVNFTTIPLNGSGTVTIPLSAPFTWINTTNPLIIEICWSAPVTSGNDDTWQTQTTGYRSYLMLSNLGAYTPASCSWTNTAPNGTTLLTFRQASDLRPNLTFKFHRVYKKFPIQLETNGATTAQWANYGSFVPAISIVEFKGTSQQNIDGTKNTTFYDLKINNTGSGNVTLMRPNTTVNDTLSLVNGKIFLNSNSITINNPGIGGIVQTNGAIQSETVPPNYGTVKWAIGNTMGSHVIPFITATGHHIPLTYNLTGGNVGTVEAATYPTSPNNIPFPPGVTNVNDTNNTDNSDYTVDRFWYIDKTGPSGKAKIKFTYKNTEAPAPIANGNVRAHRYVFQTNTWRILPYSMTNTVGLGTSEVLVMGVNGNNLAANIWALADASSPLRLSNSMQNDLEIAPNPFNDKIIITLNTIPGDNENITLTLYSAIGEMTDQTTIPSGMLSGNAQIEWSTGDIKNGIYFLVIKTKNEVRTERVVKMGN